MRTYITDHTVFHKRLDELILETSKHADRTEPNKNVLEKVALEVVVAGVVVSALALINEVNQRQAQLVLRWVTISGFNSRCGTFISVCDQPPRSTQPGHPFVGRCNEYQPKGGDALRLESKGRYGSCVGGR